MKPVPVDSLLAALEPLGAPYGRKRGRHPTNGQLYEWDGLHGEIEVYNRRGRHLGVLDAEGRVIKDAVKGRSIDV